MDKLYESMKSWSDLIDTCRMDSKIDKIDEAPMIDDVFSGDKESSDYYTHQHGQALNNSHEDNLITIAKHDDFVVKAFKNWTEIAAYDKNGNTLAVVSTEPLNSKILKIDVMTSNQKGIMKIIFDDIISSGKSIMSDTIQSPAAKAFWEKLISDPNHEIYVTIDGEVVQKATPDKLDKYWGTDTKDIRSGIQFLMIK